MAATTLQDLDGYRTLLGVPIRYGEDRFLTRQIVKRGWRTTLSLDAICFTVAPRTLSTYFSQQLRWRRSNFVDVICGTSHAWRLHPFVCVHYLALGSMLVAYPLVILEQLAQPGLGRAERCGAGVWTG